MNAQHTSMWSNESTDHETCNVVIVRLKVIDWCYIMLVCDHLMLSFVCVIAIANELQR